jgi:8-oxo-dGTP pyrophosphatase MutT (NUDIX family)
MSVPVRDAATVVLIRDAARNPSVLMGQRGSQAVFMANKVVFPGGAVDRADHGIPFARPLSGLCAARLGEDATAGLAQALAAAALRELWEETGLILGRPGHWPDPPAPWAEFAAAGFLPDPSALRFVFRAVTPPGSPRRFDARFFLADAAELATDPDDFSRASDELSCLHWIPLREVRGYDLPFITEVVLAEIMVALPALDAPRAVPFFRNDDEESLFLRLGGRAL